MCTMIQAQQPIRRESHNRTKHDVTKKMYFLSSSKKFIYEQSLLR